MNVQTNSKGKTTKRRPHSNRKSWPKQRSRVTQPDWIVKALNNVGILQAVCIANHCRVGEHSEIPSPWWESVFQQLKPFFKSTTGRELPEMKAGTRYEPTFLLPKGAA